MWVTHSTDIYHNIFGLKIARPIDRKNRSFPHDAFVLFKTEDFDVAHYESIDTIKLIDQYPDVTMKYIKDICGHHKRVSSDTLLAFTPEEIQIFLSKFYERPIRLQGVERGYDGFLQQPYHIFYFIKLLNVPGE